MDPALQELNQKVGNIFAESMGSVFSMLTGREFSITSKDGASVDHEGVAKLHATTAVYVKAHYTKGMTGTLLFAQGFQQCFRVLRLPAFHQIPDPVVVQIIENARVSVSTPEAFLIHADIINWLLLPAF